MRTSPSDVLFLILSVLTLLAAALVVGGLAAQPFSVQAGHPCPGPHQPGLSRLAGH